MAEEVVTNGKHEETPSVDLQKDQGATSGDRPGTEQESKVAVHSGAETTDDQEANSALHLYRALKDPRTAKSIIAVLAQEHDLTFAPKDTKAEKQEKVSSLRDIIKEELGDEYQFLAAKLGNVLERTLESERRLSAAQLQEIRNVQAEREAEEAFNWLKNEYDDADAYESEIATLIERTPMAKGISAKEHLEELYAIAKHRGTKAKTSSALASKIKRNSSDPDVKLNGKRPEAKSGMAARPIESLDDAIARAMDQIKG